MSRFVGREVSEVTTVTQRVRRIGEWDGSLIDRAQLLNRANVAALTFADYLDPSIEGKRELTPKIVEFIDALEVTYGFRVALIGTGGPEFTVIER
jgi:adenylosuccinate synthase